MTGPAAAQVGPSTSLTTTGNEVRLSIVPSDCAVTQCWPITLSCAAATVALTVRFLTTEEMGWWFTAPGKVTFTMAGSLVSFSLEAAAADGAGWTATLAPDGRAAEWLPRLSGSTSIDIETPTFRLSFSWTETDAVHLAAFSEMCLGTGATADRSCSFWDAEYRTRAMIATFLPGDPPTLQLDDIFGHSRQLAHTGGHGRGAAFYDPVADRYRSYWFNGIEGEIAAAAAAAQAPLTLVLEELGDFVRVCPN